MASPPYFHSHPNSRYGSPVPSQWSGDAYTGQPAGILGYDPYGSPVPMHSQPQSYGSPPFQNMARDASTPPTSSHSQDESLLNRRPRRSAAKRKNKKSTDEAHEVRLDAPLSELTKDMTDVPLRDMEVWVNRPLEERLRETEKRKGYVTRPMNSFMLYRSAYTDRTKRWCDQNNHQVVSRVSGKSWPMEPAMVRDMYNELARIERDNHQKAHPGYKFSPSKTGAQPNRKRKDASDEEYDVLGASDDDGDPDYRPSGASKRRSRPMNSNDLSYSPYGEFTENTKSYPLAQGRVQPLSASHFHASNPGLVAPEPLVEPGYAGYYQACEVPGPTGLGGSVHDVQYIRQPHPMYSQMQQSVVGLPGTGHYDLLDDHSMSGTPIPFNPAHVDPALVSGYSHALSVGESMPAIGAFSEQGFQDLDNDTLVSLGIPVMPMSPVVMQPWENHNRSEVEADFERIMRENLSE